MRARIIIRSEGLRDVTVQFNVGNYLGAIVIGREKVVKRTRGLKAREIPFTWETQFMNRRMDWQMVECGHHDATVILQTEERINAGPIVRS